MRPSPKALTLFRRMSCNAWKRIKIECATPTRQPCITPHLPRIEPSCTHFQVYLFSYMHVGTQGSPAAPRQSSGKKNTHTHRHTHTHKSVYGPIYGLGFVLQAPFGQWRCVHLCRSPPSRPYGPPCSLYFLSFFLSFPPSLFLSLSFFLSFVQAMERGVKPSPRASLPSPCWAISDSIPLNVP